MANNITKVILLVDIDCFYCQVEEKLNPNLREKPVAVVQYNTWREGGIIAANYLARAKGVTKGLWCYEAKEKCPEILFATVNEVRGRADLTKYREAGKEVFDVLQKYTTIIEKASVDEAYLDITEAVTKRLHDGFVQINSNEKMCRTHVVGYKIEDYLDNLCSDSDSSSEFSEGNVRLAMGALISEEIRAEILVKTGYKCSAGIAHNKMLAKLASGLHKPNAQTIFPQESVPNLFKKLPMQKIKRLGGKFGKTIAEELNISFVGEVTKFSEKELVRKFDEKSGKWLYNIARGIDLEPVKTRVVSNSIGCCKRFPGKNCLVSPGSVERWINEIATEVSERLERDMEENNRKAKQLVFSLTQTIDEKLVSSSKTLNLNSYEQSKIARDFLQIVNKNCRKSNGNYNNITFLGLSAGNFQNIKNNSDIKSFLKKISDHKFELTSPQKSNSLGHKNTSPSQHSQLCNNISTEYSRKSEKTDGLLDNTIEKFNSIDSNNDMDIDNDTLSSTVQDNDINNQAYSHQSIDIDNKSNGVSTSFFNNYFEKNTKSKFGYHIDEADVLPASRSDNNPKKSEKTVDDIEIFSKCNETSLDCPFTSKVDEDISSLQGNQANNTKNSEKIQSIQQVVSDDINKKEFQATSQKKRKANETPSVLTLFKKFEELNEDNSNYCEECNKRIKLEDVANHDDYHTALQIHLQLNNPSQSLNKSKSVGTKKFKESRRENGGILNFFKITSDPIQTIHNNVENR
ncbi:unnamed protein product [Phaedon cochleariae]|uniref:DNA polymerase eta n=1 Tax=Phaedon cochleariae TaxID=80249 RepID=A0A9P0DNE8_PHACE|nr:unnamed protein product [Phaedon cochleariae]